MLNDIECRFVSMDNFAQMLIKRLGMRPHLKGDWWRKDVLCFNWRQLKLADVFYLTKLFVALVHLNLVVKENEGLSQRCRQIDFILILLVLTVNLENLGSSQAKLSNFKFTTGEQLRYESTPWWIALHLNSLPNGRRTDFRAVLFCKSTWKNLV